MCEDDNGYNRIKIKKEVINKLKQGTYSSDEDIYRAIDQEILKEGHIQYGSLETKKNLRETIFNSIRKMDILERYLRDDSITEIMVIGGTKIFVEENGRVKRIPEQFDSESEVYRLIDQIVAPINRVVNESSPIVDGRLEDGSRVHIVVPPVSLEGPLLTIRKFERGGMTIEKLIEYQEFPPEFADFLEVVVKSRYNILISGATNSGKSSLINAMSRYLGREERIITIEDSAELQFFHVDNLVRLETRNANTEGENEIDMRDLIKASLRMRPDRIIVGEVRGVEAESMIQAFSTGHSGSMSSLHANSCRDALRRLETMILMGIDIPLRAVQGQIASSIQLMIHIGRIQSGERKILEVQEVLDIKDGEYVLNPLFQYRNDRLYAINVLKNQQNLLTYNQVDHYQECMERMREFDHKKMDPCSNGIDSRRDDDTSADSILV